MALDAQLLTPPTHSKTTSAVAMLPRRVTVSQPLETVHIPNARLTLTTIIALTGMSKATIYRKVAQGLFPQPVQRDHMCTRWRAADVNAYLDGCWESTQ